MKYIVSENTQIILDGQQYVLEKGDVLYINETMVVPKIDSHAIWRIAEKTVKHMSKKYSIWQDIYYIKNLSALTDEQNKEWNKRIKEWDKTIISLFNKERENRHIDKSIRPSTMLRMVWDCITDNIDSISSKIDIQDDPHIDDQSMMKDRIQQLYKNKKRKNKRKDDLDEGAGII